MAWQGKARQRCEAEKKKSGGRRGGLIWCAVATYRRSEKESALFVKTKYKSHSKHEISEGLLFRPVKLLQMEKVYSKMLPKKQLQVWYFFLLWLF